MRAASRGFAAAALAVFCVFSPIPARAQTVAGAAAAVPASRESPSIEPRLSASLDRFRFGGCAGMSVLWNIGGARPRRAGFSLGASYFAWEGALSESRAAGNSGELLASAFAEFEWPRNLLGVGIGADLRVLMVENGAAASSPGFLLRPAIAVRNPLPLGRRAPRLVLVPEAKLSWSVGGGGFVALPAFGMALGLRFQPAPR